MKIGIVGLGFVGSAIHDFLENYNKEHNSAYTIILHDKYKNGGFGSLSECLETDILFLALPTLYSEDKRKYDTSAIEETLQFLDKHSYRGVILNKSTVEPTSTQQWDTKYRLSMIHNPEFLTARTASKDFANQKHIVLGCGKYCTQDQKNMVSSWYKKCFPSSNISTC